MRIGIVAVAIRELGVVVSVVGISRDDAFNRGLYVGEQRVLPFIYDQPRRRVKGRHLNVSILYPSRCRKLAYVIGQVCKIGPLVSFDRNCFRESLYRTLICMTINWACYTVAGLCSFHPRSSSLLRFSIL